MASSLRKLCAGCGAAKRVRHRGEQPSWNDLMWIRFGDQKAGASPRLQNQFTARTVPGLLKSSVKPVANGWLCGQCSDEFEDHLMHMRRWNARESLVDKARDCKAEMPGAEWNYLLRLPEVLFMCFARFKSEGSGTTYRDWKVSTEVHMVEEVDFAPVLDKTITGVHRLNTKYKLRSVISHRGELATGHYRNHVRVTEKGKDKWWRIDGMEADPVEFEELNDDQPDWTPYLLCWERIIDTDPESVAVSSTVTATSKRKRSASRSQNDSHHRVDSVSGNANADNTAANSSRAKRQKVSSTSNPSVQTQNGYDEVFAKLKATAKAQNTNLADRQTVTTTSPQVQVTGKQKTTTAAAELKPIAPTLVGPLPTKPKSASPKSSTNIAPAAKAPKATAKRSKPAAAAATTPVARRTRSQATAPTINTAATTQTMAKPTSKAKSTEKEATKTAPKSSKRKRDDDADDDGVTITVDAPAAKRGKPGPKPKASAAASKKALEKESIQTSSKPITKPAMTQKAATAKKPVLAQKPASTTAKSSSTTKASAAGSPASAINQAPVLPKYATKGVLSALAQLDAKRMHPLFHAHM